MHLKPLTVALALLVPLQSLAQEPGPPPVPPEQPAVPAPPAPPAAPEPPAPPPPPEQPEKPAVQAAAAEEAKAPTPGLKWDGLVDTYYLYNVFSDPSLQDTRFRAFDVQSNSFTLAYVRLGLQIERDMVGARVDLGYGHTGAIVNQGSAAFGPTTVVDMTAVPTGVSRFLYNTAFFVEQAYATLNLAGGTFTLDAGKFDTAAGAEVIQANKNWLYSRSLLFFGIPINHTGVRLSWKPDETFTVQLQAVNGINNDPDNNTWKTAGISLSGNVASTGTLVTLNSYIGKDGPQGTQGDVAYLVDLVVNQTFSEALGVNLNFDYFGGSGAPRPTWWGVSLMGKLTLLPMLYVAARGEAVITNNGGYGGFLEDTNLYEGTLDVGLPFGSNYEIRLEGRADFSNEEVFVKGLDPRKNQLTLTAAFLAFF